MGTECYSTASEHGTLFVAQSGSSCPFLRTDLAPAAVDVVTPFCACGALTRCVPFEDDGSMQNVASKGEVQVIGWVVGEAERLHCRESVDCGEDVWDGWWLSPMDRGYR